MMALPASGVQIYCMKDNGTIWSWCSIAPCSKIQVYPSIWMECPCTLRNCITLPNIQVQQPPILHQRLKSSAILEHLLFGDDTQGSAGNRASAICWKMCLLNRLCRLFINWGRTTWDPCKLHNWANKLNRWRLWFPRIECFLDLMLRPFQN